MAQSFWLFGSRLNIIADHTTTKGQYDLIEGYFPPGTQTPLHRHTRYLEQLYVLEGEFTVWAGENKFVLSAGESFQGATSAPEPLQASVLARSIRQKKFCLLTK
jgi:uncharacterized RmlC-like cupin family protein